MHYADCDGSTNIDGILLQFFGVLNTTDLPICALNIGQKSYGFWGLGHGRWAPMETNQFRSLPGKNETGGNSASAIMGGLAVVGTAKHTM